MRKLSIVAAAVALVGLVAAATGAGQAQFKPAAANNAPADP